MTVPDPKAIKQARRDAGLTQTEAARLIHSTLRTWQDQEAGKARMPGAAWELFGIATGTVPALEAQARYEQILRNKQHSLATTPSRPAI